MLVKSIPLSSSLSFKQRIWVSFKRHHSGLFSVIFLALIGFCAIFIPLMIAKSYSTINLTEKNLSPSLIHWFGTDDLGRDIFIRIWYGARISLFIGISAAMIDLIIGVLWGGIAALSGGKTDELMMRIVDVLSAIPSLLVIICVMVIIGPGLYTIIIALSLFGWMTMARIVRAELLLLKEQNYVHAARALGAGFWRILFYHLLPNASGPIIVTLTLTIPSAIFTEAFLSYLGLGVQAPMASWGTMAHEGLPAMDYYPWRLFFPAAFICITMLSFNLIGDSLNDAFAESTHQ